MDGSGKKSTVHVVQLELQLATFLVPDLKPIFYLEVGVAIGIDDSKIAGLVN